MNEYGRLDNVIMEDDRTPSFCLRASTLWGIALLIVPMVVACSKDANEQRQLKIESHTQLRMHVIADAIQKYYRKYGTMPTRAGHSLSWRVAILPFLGEENESLFCEFHLEEPWNSPHNSQLIRRMPTVFATHEVDPESGKTCFLAVNGTGTALDNGKMCAANKVAEWANTAILVQVDEPNAVAWTAPKDWAYQHAKPLDSLRVYAGGHFYVITADGTEWQLLAGANADSYDDIFLRGHARKKMPWQGRVVNFKTIGSEGNMHE